MGNHVIGLLDLNVRVVWNPLEGPDYTGASTHVFAIHNGFDDTHSDLASNYNFALDYDFETSVDDAFGSPTDSRGTAVAGIGAAANGTGAVAFNTNLVGYRTYGLSFDAGLPDASDAILPARSDELGVEVMTVSQSIPTDPLLNSQWHLGNPVIGLLDLNVRGVWNPLEGLAYTGASTRVFVIDNGVDYTHSDLAPNYNFALDFDFETNVNDAFGGPTDSHGTAVAGIIGAAANGTGAVGVAFNTNLVGYRTYGFISDAWLQDIRDAIFYAGSDERGGDVMNISQGIANDADSEFGVGYNAVRFDEIENSIRDAVGLGRGGLGTTIVKSAGNSRTDNYDVNADDWTNDTRQVVVAAVDQNGFVSWYSSYGAANLVSAFGTPGDVVTTDRVGADGYSNTDFTSSFNGTSAAAPMVTGVVALMYDANAGLGWRDVQSILAESARHVGSAVGGGITGAERYAWNWNAAGTWNGGGMHFSNDYGYGLVDALAAVRLSETWLLGGAVAKQTVNQFSNQMDVLNVSTIIPDGDSTGLTFFGNAGFDDIVERVTVEMTFSTTWTGDLEVYVTSPDGTVSQLIADTGASNDFNGTWTFETQAFRGERAAGTWSVRVVDDAGGDVLTVSDIVIRTFGEWSSNDRYVFTNEYSDYAGLSGHLTAVTDSNGGTDIVNASAVTTASIINLEGISTIDGVDVTFANIENVIGGDGSDSITGSDTDNVLYGMRGNDTINGGSGVDTVYGGDGNDTVDGGDGDDLIYLGTGDDYLNIVSSGDDTFWGSTGNDYIYGYVGNETYYGEDGNDTLLGHSGDDTLDGGEGEDSIEGGVGNDTIHGGSGVDTLYGGTGNDTLDGGLYEDSCYGDEGNDTFQVTAADFGDNVYGGADIDTLDLGGWTYSSIAFRVNLTTQIYEFLPNDYGIDGTYDAQSIENVIGSNFNDDFNGSEFGNNLDGGAGDDTIAGAAGDDTVYGGDGNDNVDGGDGDDLIYLGAGDDYLNIVSSGDDTFWGSTGNDYIYGYVGNETYYGEDGNDTLLGHSGDDTLDGGEGEDSIEGGVGNDTIHGGSGVDTLYGGTGNDTLDGGLYEDSCYGDEGNDTFQVTAADFGDNVYGGADIDTLDLGGWTYSSIAFRVNLTTQIYEFLPNDYGIDGTYDAQSIENVIGSNFNDDFNGSEFGNNLDGGAGDDTIAGAAGDDTVYGGDGNDNVDGGDGDDLIYLGAGDDYLNIVSSGDDTFWGSTGNDYIYGYVGNETYYGEDGNDTLLGHSGDDTLDGGEGEDSIEGGVGNDTIHGGSGVDTLYGGTGNDTLDGGLYEDSCYGDEGNDTFQVTAADFGDNVYGGADIDTLDLGGWTYSSIAFRVNLTTQIYEFLPNDYGIDGTYDAQSIENVIGSNFNDDFNGSEFGNNLDGGAGDDTIAGAAGDDTVYGGDGNDNVDGGDGDDLIYLGAGDDYLNIVSSGDDTFWGSTGNDYIFGYVGNETYYGEDGNDTLLGHSGDDTLDGGEGEDSLTGGSGNDNFVYASMGNGVDSISDFADGDRITIVGTTLILPITSGDGTALQQNQVQMSSASGVTTLHIGTDNLVGADVEIALAGELLPSQLRVSGSSILYNHAPNLASPTSADYFDSSGDDTFTAASGPFSGSDIDPDTTLSYGIVEGTVSSGVATKVGAYGTLSVNIGTGDYTFTPNDTAIEARKINDSETFSVTVSDGSATANASFTVNVTGADDPTTFSGVATATVSEDGTITAAQTLTVSDRDTGDEAITPQSNTAGNYGAFGIGADGAWTYALNNAASAVQSLGIGQSLSDSFTAVTAGGATQVVTVTINGTNDAPTASHRTVTTNEDTARILAVADFGFSDVDSGDTLQAVTVTSLPAVGSLKLNGVAVIANQVVTAADITAGKLVFSPAANANGAGYASFGFKVSDGTALSDSAYTMTVNVTPVNDAPTASHRTVTSNEDTARILTVADFGFSDVDSGDTLQAVTVTSLPAVGSLKLNGVAVIANQVVTAADITADKLVFSPAANANGAGYASFGFKVSDGTALSDSAYSMTVNVTPVNDAPTASHRTVTTNEDTARILTVADFGFSDVDSSDTLQAVTVTSLPTAGSLKLNGVAVIANQVVTAADITAGKLVFTPAANANGAGYASFGFKVSDGTALSASAYSMTVNVTPMNDAPTASHRTVTTNEDTARILAVADFGFSDVDSGDTLQAVTVTSLPTAGGLKLNGVAVTASQSISVADITAGKLVFTPVLNANGAGYASFGFKVSDGTALSDSAYSMTVNVTPVNDAPTASHRTVTTNEDTARILTVADFGFSDVDSSDTLQAVTVTSLPTAGSLKLNGVAVIANQVVTAADITAGKLVFTPAANANGAGYASFGFKVSDGTALSASAYSMTVNVTPMNDAPTASHRTVTTNEDTARILAVADFGFSDVDSGDTLQAVTVTSLPAAGSLRLNGVAVTASQSISVADITAGKLVFSPAANANGAGYASFGFKVSDGTALSDSAYSMTVNVTPVNDAPTASHRTVTTNEDTARILAVADFGFSDVDSGDTLQAVTVTSLPAAGSLRLNGVAVTASQSISVADITAGKLVFSPAANANGSGYASFGFKVSDGTALSASAYSMTVNVTPVRDDLTLTGGVGNDTLVGDLIDIGSYDHLIGLAGNDSLSGLAGNDTLDGGAGNDTLNGGTGADSMTGGDGSDVYYVDHTGDVVTETNATASTGGTDTAYSYLSSYTLGNYVENGRILATGAASLVGNTLNNVLYAGVGNNTLNGSTGTDTVSYAYGVTGTAGVTVILSLSAAQATGSSGLDTLIAIENLTGSSYNDTLTGNTAANVLDGGSGNDTLDGAAGNDTLNGGTGADSMTGGDGSDVYYVDHTGDVVTETNATASTGGTDTAYSYLSSYTLGNYVENGRILATGAASLVGNTLNNVLYAGVGNNTLNGSTGTDTVSYAYGVTGTAGVTVILSLSAAQATGSSGLDTLIAIENLTGSSYNDTLTGNTAANVLDGGSGNDTLDGAAGNDTLNGGTGADSMTGGDGSDVYYVDHTGDVVTETNATASTGGTDTAYSYLSSYTLGNYVENGRILATGAASLVGNTLNNVLYAGVGNNTLNGSTGTDTVSYAYGVTGTAGVTVILSLSAAQATGSSGLDTLIAIENLTGSSYNDTLTGNTAANALDGGSGNDTLDGAAGNDTLNGGTGADSMTGGDGSDVYYVDHTGDVVTETNATASTGGTDTAYSYLSSYTLGNYVENGRILATGAASLVGNTLNNVLYAGVGNNTLNGSTGTDTVSYAYGVTGTAGVTVSLSLSAAQATGSSGLDTLIAIENLTGSSYNDTLTGNTAANVLDGGSGNDTLDGAAGNDTLNGGTGADSMTGGDGSDVYYVDHTGDVVTETNATASTGGTDTAYSYLSSYTLGNYVENGRILATGAASLVGNTLNNVLYAGVGNNTLNGSTGTDTVSYAYGVTGTAGVTVSLSLSATQATGSSGLDTLIAIENLTGSSYNDTLTGNTAANVLDGGSGNDTLDGAAGNDTLNGGTGADSMTGGDGSDVYYVDHTGDVVTETNATASTGGTDTAYSYLSSYTLGNYVENGRILATGAASLVGNTLNNVLYAGVGNNTLNGSTGTDTVSYAYGVTGTAGVTVSLSLSATQATGSSGLDTLIAIENLTGSSYNDTLTGNTATNVLDGGSGADTLDGGAGNDRLVGGVGKDLLTGSAGNDLFDFNALSEMGITIATWDVITDFVRGQDKIDLSTLDADTGVAGDQIFSAPVVGGTFSGVFANPGDLFFDSIAQVLYGNTDADAAAEFAIQLTGVSTLAATDLFL